jgi:hypothetical protein
VIFPEGEIYHHHEELDPLNDGVATILLRASEKLPAGKRGYVVPAAIRLRHDPAVAATFSARLDVLERRITWKPRSRADAVDRIYALGSALLSIKEEEFMGQAQQGPLPDRIQNLQRHLIGESERKHGLKSGDPAMPSRIRAVRRIIRQRLTDEKSPVTEEQSELLYDDLDRIYAAQQLYSYPGQYLRQNPTVDRVAETILKLEEDVLEQQNYAGPRQAEVTFGEPIDIALFLQANQLTVKSGVPAMTALLHAKIRELLGPNSEPGR